MTTDIKARLVVDDASSAVLGKIRGGLDNLHHRATEVQHEFAGMLKQALSTAAGFQFDRGIESVKELAMEGFHAAVANEEQIKSLAALVSMTDKSGMSFEDSMKAGAGLKDELEAIGIAAGQSGDAVIDAFSTIAERSGRSREEVVALTQNMAQAGRGTRGGIEGIANAYRDLEAGVVRPKNALVALMRQTGTVGGTAREVAKSLTNMLAGGGEGRAKVFEMADQAIGRMAGKMKAMPLTFGEVVKSMQILRENIFESLGGPMVKAITPALTNLKDLMVKHKAEIESYAEVAGAKLGEWITDAAEKVREGFEYLKTHADEIERAIKSGVEAARETFAFILAHKEEIAVAFGVKAAAPAIGGALSMGKGAMNLGGMLAGGGGLAGAGIGASAAALAAFAAAIVAVGAAAYQGYQLWKEMPRAQDDIDAKMKTTQSIMEKSGALSKEDLTDIDRFRAEMVRLAQEAGQNSAAIGAQVDAMWAARMAREGETQAIQAAFAGGTQADAGKLVAAYEKAVAANDEAHQMMIAELLDKSVDLQLAFAAATDNIAGGFDHLTGMMKDPKNMKALLAEMHPGSKGSAPPPVALSQTFNGGIQVKQDFKDMDPERVIVAFKTRLATAGTSRLQARGASPSGF